MLELAKALNYHCVSLGGVERALNFGLLEWSTHQGS